MKKTVAIAGGGLAGLSAAVFLAEKGFVVRLMEASPKLGGRAYSFFDRDRNMFFDNGQHLLAGWYKNTFDYLRKIGTYETLKFQERLEINFVDRDRRVLKFRSSGLKPPLNLLSAILAFRGFTLKEKLSIMSLKTLLSKQTLPDHGNSADLLAAFGQSGNLMKFFWEPFILAVFNTTPDRVSQNVFRNVLRAGILNEKGFLLVIPEADLNKIFVDPAEVYLTLKGSMVEKGRRISGAVMNSEDSFFLDDDGKKIFADYYISAVPFFSFPEVFGKLEMLQNTGAENLKTSAIVSLHFFMEDDHDTGFIPENSLGMTGLTGTTAQWVFRRSDKYFNIVISGADDSGVTEMNSNEIAGICIRDLEKSFEGFSRKAVKDFKVIKEKRATFIPDSESNLHRPSQETGYKNFFIAGDWTNTGLPSTIESAILSARICADKICKAEGIRN